MSGTIVLLFLFESKFVWFWRVTSNAFIKCCGRQIARQRGVEYDETDYSRSGLVLSDDLYYDLNFDSLVKLFKQTKKDKTRYKSQLIKGMYTEKEKKEFIKPYIKMLDRNQAALLERLEELIEMHEEVLEELNPERPLITMDDKLKALSDLFNQATDKNNAEKDKFAKKIDEELVGSIISEQQSYNLMDNVKYNRVLNLMKIMQETFGYDDNAKVLTDKEKFDKYLEHESDNGTIIDQQTQKDDLSDLFRSTNSPGKPEKPGKRVTIRESVNIINELDEIVGSDEQSQVTP